MKHFQRVSTERLLINPDWRWYLLRCTALCIVHTLLFFTDLEIGAP